MKFKNILAVAFGLIFLCACFNSKTIYIGGILPMSGDYYFYGSEIKKGVDLAISKRDNVLGKKIKFVVADDQSEHMKNIDAYNKFAANKKICSIIGGGNSILTEDIASVSQKKPLPIITPTASLKSITEYGPNIYRCVFTDETEGICMAEFVLKDLKAKTAAVFYDMDNDYSIALAKSFLKKFNEGGKVLTEQSHPTSDNDFRIQLNKIKLVNPDVLFIPDYAYNTVLILKQARDMGIKSVILGPDTFEEAIEQANDKSIFDNAYYCSHYSTDNTDPAIQKFVNEFKKEYESIPSSVAALSFDAANILLDAIQKANSTDSQAILNALAQTNHSGVTGNIKFDENHNPIKDITIIKVSNGKNEFLKTFTPTN